MFKYFVLIFLFFFLNNCTSPGTALFSPIITGVKTGSAYKTSLSYSSNKMINGIIKLKDIENQKDPVIVSSFTVIQVEISEIEEPEPLP